MNHSKIAQVSDDELFRLRCDVACAKNLQNLEVRCCELQRLRTQAGKCLVFVPFYMIFVFLRSLWLLFFFANVCSSCRRVEVRIIKCVRVVSFWRLMDFAKKEEKRKKKKNPKKKGDSDSNKSLSLSSPSSLSLSGSSSACSPIGKSACYALFPVRCSIMVVVVCHIWYSAKTAMTMKRPRRSPRNQHARRHIRWGRECQGRGRRVRKGAKEPPKKKKKKKKGGEKEQKGGLHPSPFC